MKIDILTYTLNRRIEEVLKMNVGIV